MAFVLRVYSRYQLKEVCDTFDRLQPVRAVQATCPSYLVMFSIHSFTAHVSLAYISCVHLSFFFSNTGIKTNINWEIMSSNYSLFLSRFRFSSIDRNQLRRKTAMQTQGRLVFVLAIVCLVSTTYGKEKPVKDSILEGAAHVKDAVVDTVSDGVKTGAKLASDGIKVGAKVASDTAKTAGK